jgi:hypothetical protein
MKMTIEASVQYKPSNEVGQRIYYFVVSGENLKQITSQMDQLKKDIDEYLNQSPENSSIELDFESAGE